MNKYEIGVAKWCLTLMLAICILGAWAKAGFPQIDIGPNATKAIENLIPIIGIVCGATLLIAIFFFFAKDRSGERRAMQQMYEAQRDCARADEAEYNLDAQRLQLALAQEMIALEKMRLQEVQQAQQSCDASAYGFSIPCDAGASTSASASSGYREIDELATTLPSTTSQQLPTPTTTISASGATTPTLISKEEVDAVIVAIRRGATMRDGKAVFPNGHKATLSKAQCVFWEKYNHKTAGSDS